MRRKFAVFIFIFTVISIFTFGIKGYAEGEGNSETYTEKIITYVTSDWTSRANKIGSHNITPSPITIVGDSRLYISSWVLGSSTGNYGMRFTVSESFSTTFTGYKDIEFISELLVGFTLSSTVGSKNISLSYVLVYDYETDTYRPSNGQGYLSITGEEPQLIDVSENINNRTNPTQLSYVFQNSNVATNTIVASYSEINYQDTVFRQRGYDWALDSSSSNRFIVALLEHGQSSTVNSSASTEIPAVFYDKIKELTIKEGINSGTLQTTISPIMKTVSAIKYSFDYKIEVMDLKDVVVNDGEAAIFRSDVKTSRIGTIAEDESFYNSNSYFEVSSDDGKTWFKISGSEDKNEIELLANESMNGYLYRNVVEVDNGTKVISQEGKLIVNTTSNPTPNNTINNPTSNSASNSMFVNTSQIPPTGVDNQIEGWAILFLVSVCVSLFFVRYKYNTK